jgi:hypothetical protein
MGHSYIHGSMAVAMADYVAFQNTGHISRVVGGI